jgi:N-acetylglucosamine malate deacetylase 1
MTRIILVVAAHPDDEILGCGGTMARHADMGDNVNIVIVAEGATSRGLPDAGSEVEALRDSGRQAAALIGASEPKFLGLPDNRLDELPLLDVIRPIEQIVEELGPSVVYTHHGGDLNIDHRMVHEAVLTACRPLPGASVRTICAFETISSTEWGGPGTGPGFSPNYYVEITDQIDRKLEALKCYAIEMRDFPHPRSYDAVRMQAGLRGTSCGLSAAEAFVVLRQIKTS